MLTRCLHKHSNLKMGRRYNCEYCQKTFIDVLEARKRHLSSPYHIKQRKLYYDLQRDPRDVLAEESVKGVCRKFTQQGECQYGANCKYTHYTPEELWNLKQQIDLWQYQQKCVMKKLPEIPSLESWVEKYNEKYKNEEKQNDTVITYWAYPEHLEYRTDLPPSIKKFKPEDFKNSNFEEWG